MTVPLAVFGPGILFVTRTDGTGPYTPVNIGYAQEFSYDEDGPLKDLYGQDQFPLVSARGTIKASGKIKAATLSALAMNAVFFGQGFASGQRLLQQQQYTLSGASITVAPPNSGTFDGDLGVLYQATNLPFSKVSGAPAAAGQYEESGAAYTFHASDSGTSIVINDAYKLSGAGQIMQVNNTLIGTNPQFQLDYYSILNGQAYYIRFFRCVASKLVRAHKLTDFVMPEFDIGFYANDGGQVYEGSFPNIS